LGDVCGAGNTQFEQEFLGLFRVETVSAYDWRDRIGDFCVADYVEELDTMHVMRYSTRFGLHLRRKAQADPPAVSRREGGPHAGVRPALVANGRRFIAGYRAPAVSLQPFGSE
jgi:hypothetical protein